MARGCLTRTSQFAGLAMLSGAGRHAVLARDGRQLVRMVTLYDACAGLSGERSSRRCRPGRIEAQRP